MTQGNSRHGVVLPQRSARPRPRCPAGYYAHPRAKQALKFHLEPHKIKVVAIGAHSHHELAAVLAEPYLTETMVCRERLDEPSGPAERLIVSQRQIHPVIIPDLRPSVEHDL